MKADVPVGPTILEGALKYSYLGRYSYPKLYTDKICCNEVPDEVLQVALLSEIEAFQGSNGPHNTTS